MRILFIAIGIVALGVGIWALCVKEYIIAFAMLLVIGGQVFNYLKYCTKREGLWKKHDSTK